MVHIKRQTQLEHAQNAQTILRMRKVSIGPLLSIHTLQYPMIPLADSVGPDQTARMRSLIRAFAVRTMMPEHTFLHGATTYFWNKTVWCEQYRFALANSRDLLRIILKDLPVAPQVWFQVAVVFQEHARLFSWTVPCRSLMLFSPQDCYPLSENKNVNKVLKYSINCFPLISDRAYGTSIFSMKQVFILECEFDCELTFIIKNPKLWANKHSRFKREPISALKTPWPILSKHILREPEIDRLCWDLTTRLPLWVILCRLPEKGRREIEEIAEEKKERDMGEGGKWMKVKIQKK